MSQTQYNSLMGNLLNQQHTLTKLRAKKERERFVSVVRSLGTQSKIAETKGRRRKEKLFPKISLRC